MKRLLIDPLTYAYIGIGAHMTLKHEDSAHLVDAAIEKYEGELGFIGKILSYAHEIDEIERDDLVHAYDIAEPFGTWAAAELLEGREIVVQTFIDKVLAK